ncbi:asparagine synthase (glutamine-hydrolyzing) [Acidibrevibacterium fodinaquatile]|uniref:asparagine synthase (glutamine-hydrolyzing) n=1 Tax=Acidibrevibacterium fodinaquatile TaxID=1969806 RepID=UPI000E0DC908|nr:asparagine synthase (glutamine-hydrolyzing) [Acidibrevibacterium fodinaquatile]
MCGIAGVQASAEAPAPAPLRLARLAAALTHRGPDGMGEEIAGRVGLVQTRLAIIDLAGGRQPLHAGAASLVANGEIYNYRELHDALSQGPQPPRFATASDCEPPLHLWHKDGLGFVGALRGMYAIALHDRAARRLVLARDPFGIKPLYLAQGSEGLVFASEPEALLAAGVVARAVAPESREELLQLQFTTGAATIYPGIQRVLPGEILVAADGHVIERRHTPALPAGGPEVIDEAQALARLDAALADSVALHQRSDVPYGLFLSGGIDSAALLTMMARLNAAPVLAFTAGFDVPGAADEREAAAALARAAGARHETMEISRAMVWRHLPEIVAAMDDPAADFAIIPTWFLGRAARQAVKVVLSGEGGDEMFAGYGRYRSAMRPWFLGGRVMRGRGIFDRVPGVLRARSGAWRDGIAAAEAAASPGRTRLMAAQASDIAEWLPNDLLLKLDRCLMAHGVEGRTPFLDRGVADAVFRLPDRLKIRNGMGKYLLRAWLAAHQKAARPFARKQGFTVPVGAWIAEDGERLGALVAASPGIAEIAHPDRVRALFRAAGGRHHGQAAWTLLFYALWHRAHILGQAPAGDVFSALAGE